MKKTYIGAQTAQAQQNFPFSIHHTRIELIYAITEIKKAAAIAHEHLGKLDNIIVKAIVDTCDEILKGRYDDQFVTSAFQGGAGTSINTNVNEVIALRATEILQSQGVIQIVHPNDHVNKSQSTNDVNPSALRVVVIRLVDDVIKQIEILQHELTQKSRKWDSVRKLGRTHLQDAVPTTLGEEFLAYAAIVQRGKDKLQTSKQYLYDLNLGGTAIGSSINASEEYLREVYIQLENITSLPVRRAKNLMALTSSQTDFVSIMHSLVSLLVDLSKIASDIRLMASGPNGGLAEISLKELQHGSTIMPGKVNPILPETVNQLYFLVSGHAHTIEQAAHASQLELGVMFPILADSLIQSFKLSSEVIGNFATICVPTIVANEQRCLYHLEHSTAYATLLTPKLGYDTVSEIVRESQSTGETIRSLVIKKRLLTEEEFNKLISIML